MIRCIDCRGWFKPRNGSDYRCTDCTARDWPLVALPGTVELKIWSP